MKVLLTGGTGMLGRNISRAWKEAGGTDELVVGTRRDADLTDALATRKFIRDVNPDAIIHTAARVGGILANMSNQMSFLMDNLLIDTSVLSAAAAQGVSKLIYVGSSCMYPRDYRQPLIESDVLASPLEPTNEGYAISKIAGARFCQYASDQMGVSYRVVIPSNLYGPGDHFDERSGHLVAAALLKVHRAKESTQRTVEVWGDGLARREFTYVGDLAAWIVQNWRMLDKWPCLMNVGAGTDHTVLEYYRMAMEVVGYKAELRTDPSRPAGMHQKLMDSSCAKQFGWRASTGLHAGMERTYSDFLSRQY